MARYWLGHCSRLRLRRWRQHYPRRARIPFDLSEIHALELPDGRALATFNGSPHQFKDSKAWATAMTETIAAHAWHEAGVPHAGEA